MAEQIILAYNPSDFFYVKAETDENMPTKDECTRLLNAVPDLSCNDTNFRNNKTECINKELCINKNNAEWIRTYQNINGGSKQTYMDTVDLYNESYLTTINLGIGIIILMGVIIGNRYI